MDLGKLNTAEKAPYEGPDRTQQTAGARKPNFKLPKGYVDEQQFLQEMRKLFNEDQEADRLNREAGSEDLKFVIGDQWEDYVRSRRDAGRKPTLTINRLPAFVAQVLGSRRLNETEIRIVPDNGGDIDIAEVREGLIRSIQKLSRAKRAYDNALAGSVMCGIGNFQVCLDDATNDIWARDIKIKPILDHFAVVWDRNLTDPTGRDAERAFVIETMTKYDFYAEWPWAQPSDVSMDLANRYDLRSNGWLGVDDVRVVNYWRMRKARRTYALMMNGATVDITDINPEDDMGAGMLASIAATNDGEPIIREVNVRYAQLYICSGTDILDGPYNYPIDRVPVFRVPGWEVKTGERWHRWGIVRHAKDPQRLHNYWRSAVAEKLMQTPRSVWMASDTAVQGREQQWRNSHLTDDPLLIWNAESGNKPERVPPAQVEDALLAQAMITSQDIKDVTNIHEANLGMPSNEVSKVAIQQRQAVSDTGSVIYHDNLTAAIEECGRVCNDLIPVVYDSIRTIKVLGEDGKENAQVINDMNDPLSVDITLGKYSVTATTGPAYDTKRKEQAEFMLSIVNSVPQLGQVAGDLILEAQDVAGAKKLAKRLRNNMPGVVFEPDEMTPEMAQRDMAQAQGAQAQQQLAMMAAGVDLEQKRSQATLNLARARNFMVQAGTMPDKNAITAANTASQIADRRVRAQLEAVRVFSGQ
ncbi:MAG TPA: portal protein [Sphingomonas sp.]|nr:portal protein [Sphingomonas sp.]